MQRILSLPIHVNGLLLTTSLNKYVEKTFQLCRYLYIIVCGFVLERIHNFHAKEHCTQLQMYDFS